jgi:DNA-binding NarL/FixJ family response regulator
MVRDLTQEELVALKQGLRSSDAFTLRRSQILLASNQGQTPQQVAAQLHSTAVTSACGKLFTPSMLRGWPA